MKCTGSSFSLLCSRGGSCATAIQIDERQGSPLLVISIAQGHKLRCAYENIAGNKDRRAEALFHSLLLSFETLKKWAESTYFLRMRRMKKFLMLSLSPRCLFCYSSRNKLLVSLSPVELREVLRQEL